MWTACSDGGRTEVRSVLHRPRPHNGDRTTRVVKSRNPTVTSSRYIKYLYFRNVTKIDVNFAHVVPPTWPATAPKAAKDGWPGPVVLPAESLVFCWRCLCGARWGVSTWGSSFCWFRPVLNEHGVSWCTGFWCITSSRDTAVENKVGNIDHKPQTDRCNGTGWLSVFIRWIWKHYAQNYYYCYAIFGWSSFYNIWTP